jgi:hypothetical protein
MRYSIFFFLVVLFFTSCIKEIDYQVVNVPKQLVINSIISAYQPVCVHVSGLQSILDTSLFLIDNATVILEEKGGDVDTLTNLSKGNYVSYIYGKPGKEYLLKVQANGYPTASAVDTMPEKVPINYASRHESTTVDDWGNPHNDYTVSFSKQKGKINYYELFFINQWKQDSIFWIFFESTTVIVDPIILASGKNDFNYTTFLFSDATIPEGDYTIAMKMVSGETPGGSFEKPIITIRDKASAVVLRTVSKSYYDYRSSWEKHQYFKNDSTKVEDFIFIPLVGEPQEMYSNIENGLGIFAAYNQDYSFY